MAHAAPPTWARPELRIWLQPRPEGAAPVLPWPSLPPVPPSRGLGLHGALLWEGLCKQQAWRPARAVVPLPSGFSAPTSWAPCSGCDGASALPLAGSAALAFAAASAFAFACASAFASASCLLAACSFAHCGGGAGAVFGGGPFAVVGAPVTGGGLTAGGGNGTDGGGGGAGAAGEDAAAMGAEGGRLTVRAVPVQAGRTPACPFLGLLDRAGLNGLASMISPALKAPTPSLKPSSVRSPRLSETTGPMPSRATAAWRRKLGPGPATQPAGVRMGLGRLPLGLVRAPPALPLRP